MKKLLDNDSVAREKWNNAHFAQHEGHTAGNGRTDHCRGSCKCHNGGPFYLLTKSEVHVGTLPHGIKNVAVEKGYGKERNKGLKSQIEPR